MKEVSTSKAGERKEYPETLTVEVGESIVAIVLEQHQAETRYGESTVCEVVVRGKPVEKTYSLFWPYRLPTPPLNTPFYLARREKKVWHLQVAESKEECALLWKDGALYGPPAAGMNAMSPAAKVIASFGS